MGPPCCRSLGAPEARVSRSRTRDPAGVAPLRVICVAPRSLPAMHRFLRILSTTLVTAGLVVAIDVGLTLAWEEPLSNRLRDGQAGPGGGRARGSRATASRPPRTCAPSRARRTRRSGPSASPTASTTRVETGAGHRPAFRAGDRPRRGAFVEGTDTASLQKGPGHYSPSDDPDTRGTGRRLGVSRARARRSGSRATAPRTSRRSASSTSSSRVTS